MEDHAVKENIKELLASVEPYDKVERVHIEDALQWIASGAEIFRVKKDAVPPKHLVSYAVVFDQLERKVLLLHHKKSQLMLPSGGHVDKNEMPLDAARRELMEELGLSLEVIHKNNDISVPFFVTVTQTAGLSEQHTDVSLWYVFKGDMTEAFDTKSKDFIREFSGYQWLGYEEVLTTPIDELDPHMHRFIQKMQVLLV